ncbi:hypothetical protein JCM16303_005528 [Sporobolomyces ruberrimus]
MSYDPYSHGGGYTAPPPPQQQDSYHSGGPPPPQFQPNPHARRDSGAAPYDRYSGPPPPSNDYQYGRGRSPPRNGGGAYQQERRRSASPSSRGYGDDRGGGGRYGSDRGGRGGGRGGRFGGRDDRGDSYGGRRDDGGSFGGSDRAKEERPGRIIFVRNLKFGVTPEEVREKFAEIGDIKTFFDLVEKRAMAFITYYDARAAMMAKDRLHNALLQGRPMDVHFSLPRDADMAQDCDRDKGQGTLSLVILPFPGARINQALPAPTESEVYARFSPFGDLKQVFPSYKRPDMTYIEFFDSRGTCLAYDKVHGSRMAGGIADLRFVWDKYPMDQSRPPPGARRNDRFGSNQDDNRGPPPSSSYGGPSDRYGPPPGAGYNGGPPPPPVGYGGPPVPPPYGNYGPPPPGAPVGPGPGFNGPPGPYGSIPPPPVPSALPPTAYGYDNRPPLPPGPSYDRSPYQQHQAPPPLASAPPTIQEPSHGVEQAKKMQDLLATLMANPNALSGVLPPPAPAPVPVSPVPPPQTYQSPSLQAPPIPPLQGNSTPLPAAVSSLLAQAGVPQPPPSVSQTTVQSPPRASVTPQQQLPPAQPSPNKQEQVGNSQVQALLALLAQQKAQSN